MEVEIDAMHHSSFQSSSTRHTVALQRVVPTLAVPISNVSSFVVDEILCQSSQCPILNTCTV